MNDDLQSGFCIGDWEVYPQENLLKGPDREHVLEPKVMDLLVFLASRQGDVVSRQQLLDAVWTGVVVADETLTRAISVLRSELRDNQQTPRYLKTISKRGYSLIAEVTPIALLEPQEVESVANFSASSGHEHPSTLINELKRRNVFRVAIAYAIVAWLLIEITATTFPILKLPDWSVTLVTVLVLIGFPLALILAWAFELTPEGIKLEKDVVRSESITHVTGRKLDFIIITVLVLALSYFAYDKFLIPPESVTVSGDIHKSIAVLPFVNMSDDPGNEYFSDGLSEEILNLLARIPGLKVIGRTSSFAFKGKNEDLRVIGQTLGVKTVLEGSVRKSGDRVRITAQLNDVSDGSHIWSESYDRTMTDIFAVQDDVAAAIIDALQIQLGTNPTRGRPTDNTEAYSLYLKARASLNNPKSRDAEELVLHAIELDPNFAEAYEFLGQVYWAHAGSMREAGDAQKLMGKAAANALAIDPDLVFARLMYQLGNIETYSHLGEIEALERAVREAPNDTKIMGSLIFPLIRAGYLESALDIAERRAELEPLLPASYVQLSEALSAVERTSEAIAALEFAVQLGVERAQVGIGVINLVDKRDEAAIANIEASLEQDGLPSDWVRDLVIGARNPVTGLAYLERRIPEIVASRPAEEARITQWRLSNFYLFFGFLDRYFEIILATELADSRWTDAENLVYFGTRFRRLGFTAHPKYLEVAESIGIIDIWEKRGPPDFCEKVDGQWVFE